MPSHFSFESIAARLDAGTYSPAIVARTARDNVEIPAVDGRPMRDYLAELAASAALGAVIGLLLAS